MLTRRDEEILKAIHFYRYMTALDVATLLFSASSIAYVRKQLTALAGGGDGAQNDYLYRFGLPKATKGNVERIYTLGSRGRDFLVNTTGLPVNWYYRPARMANLNYSYIVHSLAVTRFLIAAANWSKKHDAYKVIGTRINYVLANTPRKEENTIIPDGWLLFQRSDGNKGSVLLEIDRGTEYQERFKKHIALRVEYVQSEKYVEVFGEKSVQVVYVYVGDVQSREVRIRSMLRWTREVLKDMEMEN